MTETKSRTTDETPDDTSLPTGTGVVVPPADDQTAIDDLEARKEAKAKKSKKEKKEKEHLPEGFKKRLTGGVIRKIKVIKKELDKPIGKPFRVTEPDGTETDYDNLEIEGPSRMRRTTEVDQCVSRQSVHIETDAPILVGRGRQVKRK